MHRLMSLARRFGRGPSLCSGAVSVVVVVVVVSGLLRTTSGATALTASGKGNHLVVGWWRNKCSLKVLGVGNATTTRCRPERAAIFTRFCPPVLHRPPRAHLPRAAD